jgi:hypothetical protein
MAVYLPLEDGAPAPPVGLLAPPDGASFPVDPPAPLLLSLEADFSSPAEAPPEGLELDSPDDSPLPCDGDSLAPEPSSSPEDVVEPVEDVPVEVLDVDVVAVEVVCAAALSA